MSSFHYRAMPHVAAIILTAALSSPSGANTDSQITVNLLDNGRVNLEIDIKCPPVAPATPKASAITLVVPVPFSILPDYDVHSAEDVRVAILSSGADYALVLLAASGNRQRIQCRIDNAARLDKTKEGKARFSCDISYPYIAQLDRELVALSWTISDYNLVFALPDEYSDTEVSFYPTALNKIDKMRYMMRVADARQHNLSAIWIAFPNPMALSLNIAKILASVLFGIFTLVIHRKAFRGHNLVWALSVAVLSLVVLAVTLYFYVQLTERIEFLAFAAACIPHAAYGLFASAYFLVARKRQAAITGQVTLGHAPAKFVSVSLIAVGDREDECVVATRDNLEDDGRYLFYAWVKRGGGRRFAVTAKGNLTEKYRSDPFTVHAKGRYDLDPIVLHRTIVETATTPQEEPLPGNG